MNTLNPFDVLEERLTAIERILQEIKSPQKPSEPDDRCGIEEARIILGTPGRPVSKALVYKLTHGKKVQFMKFGRALVFSRKQLLSYREEHTLTPSSPVDTLRYNIIASAKKHMRNAK